MKRVGILIAAALLLVIPETASAARGRGGRGQGPGGGRRGQADRSSCVGAGGIVNAGSCRRSGGCGERAACNALPFAERGGGNRGNALSQPSAPNPQRRRGGTGAACIVAEPPAAGAITEAERAVLNSALIDEYQSEGLYADALARFGTNRRFENLQAAEGRHAAAILALFDRYGVSAPSRDELERAALPNTLKETIELAIQLESDQGPLYDRLLRSVEKPDIRGVFERLREVSLSRHLPALQRGGGGGRN